MLRTLGKELWSDEQKLAHDLPSFEPKTDDGIFLAWNMEVVQGADVLIHQGGKAALITVSAPKPWPTHIIPTRQNGEYVGKPMAKDYGWAIKEDSHGENIPNR